MEITNAARFSGFKLIDNRGEWEVWERRQGDSVMYLSTCERVGAWELRHGSRSGVAFATGTHRESLEETLRQDAIRVAKPKPPEPEAQRLWRELRGHHKLLAAGLRVALDEAEPHVHAGWTISDFMEYLES